MNTSAPIVAVRLRVDIGPDCSIGPGKIALLEQIERSGSLSKAARVLKMSYRRAWLLLEDLNQTLGQRVTTASVGIPWATAASASCTVHMVHDPQVPSPTIAMSIPLRNVASS